jgi:spermidine synthase
MTHWIYLIFFVSGMSGLAYQVVWVREFGQIFGNTVSSACIVSGIFILGLGLGSYIAGKLIDRRARSNPTLGLKYYALSEFIIAILGALIGVLLPLIESMSPAISSYVLGENGWNILALSSYFFRGVIALILILPITMLMGATLTFLIRFVVGSKVKNAGWKVGLLYGLNTLGAAIGCLGVDLWTVPNFGLSVTKFLAVFLSLGASMAAFGLLKMRPVDTDSPEVAEQSISQSEDRIWPAGLAILLSGFCAMGLEIVWFRFLNSLFSGRRVSFSVTLFVILVGMWIGSVGAGALSKKIRKPEFLFMTSQFLFSLFTLAGFYFFTSSTRTFFVDRLFSSGDDGSFQYFLLEQFQYFFPALKLLFAPAIFMGAAFPLINAMVQKNSGRVGTRAGALYFWNSLGALSGSLLTGLYLLPEYGIQDSAWVLCVFSMLAILPVFYFIFRELPKSFFTLQGGMALACFVGTSFVMFRWSQEPPLWLVKNGYLQKSFEDADNEILKVSEGIHETAMVVMTRSNQSRSLYTNGHPMSGDEYTAKRYMRAFAHIPLLLSAKPETALVICFGVGNTTHAVSLHKSIKSIDVVDISNNVLELAPNFNNANQGILQDPRVHVYVNDGRQHLRMQKEMQYDLVTLEPPPLVSAGVASLYSTEFYRLAFRKLKPGGFLTQWLPIYQVDGSDSRKLIRAFLEVFPNGVLLNGYGREMILMGQKEGPNQVEWRGLQPKIDGEPDVKADLARVDLSKPVEILGTFIASGPWLKEHLKNTSPMNDDIPTIEYSHYIVNTDLPKELFEPASVLDWCPSCFKDQKLLPELSDLGGTLSLMRVVYKSESYNRIAAMTQLIPMQVPLVETTTATQKENVIRPIEKAEYNSLVDSYGALRRMFGPRHF